MHNMRQHLLTALAIVLLVPPAFARNNNDPKKWEKTIATFEAADKEHAPPKHATLFIGSSSIRMWKLHDSFGDFPAINRGFGGSQIMDSTFYADRIVWPYEPKTIVLYAGDNDMAGGNNADEVLADFEAFVKKVREKLPDTRIIYIPIKPSLARWKLWPKMKDANAKVAAMCDSDKKLTYADCATPMLGSDGTPRPELFLKDGLHMNAEGYKIWAGVIAPMIGAKASD